MKSDDTLPIIFFKRHFTNYSPTSSFSNILLVCHEGIQLYAGEFQINEMTDEVRYMGGELNEKDTASCVPQSTPCPLEVGANHHDLVTWKRSL
jgi:hypothetical protein